jgi:hypothetical protein
MANSQRIGIVLSGTAPAMTLMSGAMLAFADHGVERFRRLRHDWFRRTIGMLHASKQADRQKGARVTEPLRVRLAQNGPILGPQVFDFCREVLSEAQVGPKFTLAPEDRSEAAI